jgi:hypothetical protein
MQEETRDNSLRKLFAAKQIATVIRKRMEEESFMEIKRHIKLKRIIEKINGLQKMRISFAKWR